MTSDRRTERLWRGHSGRLLAVLSVGWFGLRLGRETIPPLLPTIIDDLAISPAHAGVALSVMLAFYALLQYPSGRVSDQLSRKIVLVASILLLIVGFVAIMGVSSYAGFLLALTVIGIGGGLFFVPARALISEQFVARRGTAFGVHAAAGSLGATGAAGLAAVVVALATWRLAFLPAIALLVLVVVTLYRIGDEAMTLGPVSLGVRETASRVLRTPRIRWLLLAYMLVDFSWQAILGFLPYYLQSDRGFSPTLASASFALIFVTAFVVGPIGGRLGDHFSNPGVSVAALIVTVIGLIGLVFISGLVDSTVVTVASVVIFASGLRAFPPVMQSHLMHLFSAESRGGDFGGSKMLWNGFGSLGPAYMGAMIDSVTPTAGFVGLIVLLSTSAVIIAATGIRGPAAHT